MQRWLRFRAEVSRTGRDIQIFIEPSPVLLSFFLFGDLILLLWLIFAYKISNFLLYHISLFLHLKISYFIEVVAFFLT